MDPLPTVLLISDNATSRFLQQRYLLRYGVAQQVCVAPNFQEAVQQLTAASERERIPALIMLDIEQPRNAIAFLRAYDRLRSTQPVAPIVVLTFIADLSPAELEQIKQLSIMGLIDKPLTEQGAQQLLWLAAHSHP